MLDDSQKYQSIKLNNISNADDKLGNTFCYYFINDQRLMERVYMDDFTFTDQEVIEVINTLLKIDSQRKILSFMLSIHFLPLNNRKYIERHMSPILKDLYNQFTDIKDDPFVEFCRHGYLDLVTFFFNRESALKGLDEATVNSHMDVVDFLVSEKNVDFRANNLRAIDLACQFGQIDPLEYYLNRLPVDIVNKIVNECLVVVCQTPQSNIVDYLLTKWYADPNYKNGLPIEICKRYNQTKNAAILFKHGA